MVHFLKSFAAVPESSEDQNGDEVIPTQKEVWDKAFFQALETLMVECALVGDEIERDCFVSRVYCWYMEKLGERKELPMSCKSKASIRTCFSSKI